MNYTCAKCDPTEPHPDVDFCPKCDKQSARIAELEGALREILTRASAWRPGQTDFAAWKSCDAVTIGELLNSVRRVLGGGK